MMKRCANSKCNVILPSIQDRNIYITVVTLYRAALCDDCIEKFEKILKESNIDIYKI